MKDELISFETARLAKEKGFDWLVPWYSTHKRKSPTNPDSFYPELSTFKNWNDDEGLNFYDRYSIPTQSLLQRWLREKYNIWVYCTPIISGNLSEYNWESGILVASNTDYDFLSRENSYEEALEEGLQEALKLIE